MKSEEQSFNFSMKHPIPLPPLLPISSGMPTIYVEPLPPINEDISKSAINSVDFQSNSDNLYADSTFSLSDDLLIFRNIALFYGNSFNNKNGKIPCSFWPVFKNSTGSSRSISELCHRWHLMVKKYNVKERKIEDLINDIRIELNQRNQKQQNLPINHHRTQISPLVNISNLNDSSNSISSHGMVHAKSHQGVPPEFEKIVSSNSIHQNSTHKSKIDHVNTARPNSKIYSIEAPTQIIRNQSTPLSRTTRKLTPFSSLLDSS
ncbi:hypothetical protein TRFO_36067 [Tritrichomonas foetus]|uniref:Uncharacterized protein n=1 Tax=Tritrichomonas foetus TaxID=1144522 RepID=A0A1J4JES8_9EUKA|nr:hypothetical protein TRFO_36067 [Tritrichomonas foetus]|eukprot:OHS97694.1 hypothetical protein TRFO_36067 [Tritrichomonas foetus]